MTMYKTAKWVTTQAKTIETKCLKRGMETLSFSGIERELLKDGAVIEIRDGSTLVLDEDKYEKNKEEYLKKVGIK